MCRIPSPENELEKETENKLIESIKNYLNETTKDLEIQLNITDIDILHSDRELEFSESLRISQEDIQNLKILSRDYFKLFSKMISGQLTMELMKLFAEFQVDIIHPPNIINAQISNDIAIKFNNHIRNKLYDGKFPDTREEFGKLKNLFIEEMIRNWLIKEGQLSSP